MSDQTDGAGIAPTPKRLRRLESAGTTGFPVSRMLPRVIGGICEFCGVLDSNLPSTYQYKLCPHFREFGDLICSYCGSERDQEAVIYRSNIKVHEHPDKPGDWVAVCDSYTCSEKHIERFKR